MSTSQDQEPAEPSLQENRVNRRAHPRQAVTMTISIAPYIDSRLPRLNEFREVQCFDVSTGGISFFVASPPDEKHFVIALGSAPEVIYTSARVAHVSASKLHAGQMYLVGCQFMDRLEPPTS